VQDGALTTETGMRYGVLLFARGTERVSLSVLRKVRALVEGGAVLVGERPEGSPSLADDPIQVKETLDVLWPGAPQTTVEKGRVYAAADARIALQSIGLEADFSYRKVQPDSRVMFIHRRLDDGDLYFLSNRVDRAEVVEASFRVQGRKPELWDPASGRTRAASYRIEGGRTEVTVPLDRFGSTFVVFRERATETRLSIPSPALETVRELAGPWTVKFQENRGAPTQATFSQLADFRENVDPGIRYFSGIATFTKDLSLDRKTIAGGRLWLDLGDVRDLAEVWVNGTLAGTVWKPPYRVDITDAVRSGRNRLEVRSVNLWVNRLIGDVQPGVSRKITFTAVDGKLPPQNPDNSGRMFRQFRMPYGADAPLRASGLIGPVRLQRESGGT
jgi:hypothetical protein